MVLSWLTLNYKDENEEAWFRKWVQDSQAKQILTLAICGFLARLAGAVWLLKFPKDHVLYIQLFIGLAPIYEIILIFVGYQKKRVAWILLIIQITFGLVQFIEFMNLLFRLVFELNEQGINVQGSFFNGIFYSLLVSMFRVAKLPWIYCSWCIAGNYIYAIIRLIIPNTTFYTNAIICSSGFLLIYFNIKGEKEQIHETQSREKNLEQQKNILDLFLPSPITICQTKDKKIDYCFENKSFMKMKETIQKKPLESLEKAIHADSQGRRSSISNYINYTDYFFDKMLSDPNSIDKSECLLKFKNIDNEEVSRYFNVKGMKIKQEKEDSQLFLLEDITVYKELDEYKDKLLATVSHDLRTPLQGSLAMIECAIDSAKIKKFLKLANKCGKGLLMLINDLLDFSQIINGKLSLNWETVQILPLLKEVIKLIKFQTKMKGIDFIFDNLLPNVNVEIHTDPNRLKQILQNLLGNALKFTKKGFIKIMVSQEIQFNEKYIKLSIEDSGIGIKPENIKKLFKMFGKLDQQDLRVNKQGVGLGLSICQEISKMLNTNPMNNGIKVQSQFEKGSIFSFFVPVNKSVDPSLSLHSHLNQYETYLKENDPFAWKFEITAEEAESKFLRKYREPREEKKLSFEKEEINSQENNINNKKQDGLKCLAIDDDQTSLLAITNYLNSLRVKYIQCSSGDEAIEIIQKEIKNKEEKSFDFILMDNEMPGMTGIETARKIANQMSVLNRKLIPIVILSGDAVDVDEGIGIKCALQKPVSKSILARAISNLIKI